MDAHRGGVDDRHLVRPHLARARGVQRGLGVAGDPREDLLVGLDARARRELAPVERRHRRLPEDPSRRLDRLDPLAPVLVRREVVEAERGMDPGVGARDLHRTPRVRVHRPDVDLVTVVAGRRRTVVAHGDRQEVEHQVRVPNLVVGPGEPAALEVVRRAGARAEEQPPEPDPRPVPPLEVGRHRNRLRARVLDVDLEVVLQVLAHPRQVVHDLDPERSELVGRADAGEL